MSIQQQHPSPPPSPPLADPTAVLSLRVLGSGPVAVIAVGGELDDYTAPLLTELVDQVMTDQPTRVVLDLADLTFLCAAGITALLRVRRRVTAQAGHLLLRNPRPWPLRILTLTEVTDLFDIDVDVGAAA